MQNKEFSDYSGPTKETIDRYKVISSETDEEFISRSRMLLPWVPNVLKKKVEEMLGGIEEGAFTKPDEVVYIPLRHFVIVKNEREKRLFAREFQSILNNSLNQNPKSPTLIALGEISVGTIKKDSLNAERRKTADIVYQILHGTSLPPKLKLPLPLERYLEIVMEASRHYQNTEAIGVDSLESNILGGLINTAAIDRFPPGALSHATQIGNRLAIEGRTRFCLNNATRILKPDQRLIFVQGGLHKPGIEQWCQRNEVRLETKTPPSISRLLPK